MHTLSWCPYSQRVQSRASTSVRALKIPNTGSHIPLSEHTDESTRTHKYEWVALLLQLLHLPYPGKVIQISCKRI